MNVRYEIYLWDIFRLSETLKLQKYSHRVKLILSLHVCFDEQDVVNSFLDHKRHLSAFMPLVRA